MYISSHSFHASHSTLWLNHQKSNFEDCWQCDACLGSGYLSPKNQKRYKPYCIFVLRDPCFFAYGTSLGGVLWPFVGLKRVEIFCWNFHPLKKTQQNEYIWSIFFSDFRMSRLSRKHVDSFNHVLFILFNILAWLKGFAEIRFGQVLGEHLKCFK